MSVSIYILHEKEKRKSKKEMEGIEEGYMGERLWRQQDN